MSIFSGEEANGKWLVQVHTVRSGELDLTTESALKTKPVYHLLGNKHTFKIEQWWAYDLYWKIIMIF